MFLPLPSKAKRTLRHHISDVVYGANDGIITTFAVVSSAAGAGLSPVVIIILGIANLMADGFSMGASKYLSQVSEQHADPHNEKVQSRSGLVDGFATFISFVIAGSLPLIPFLFPIAPENEFMVSIGATAFALLFVGGLRSFVTKQNPLYAGFEMLLVGGFAALIAYGLGWSVQELVGSTL